MIGTGSDDGSSGIATGSVLTFGGHPAMAGPEASSTQGARSTGLSSSSGGSAVRGLAAITDAGDGGDAEASGAAYDQCGLPLHQASGSGGQGLPFEGT